MLVGLDGTQTPLQPAGVPFTNAAWSPTGAQLCGLTWSDDGDGDGVAVSLALYARATNTARSLTTVPPASFANSTGCAWQPRG